MLVCLLSSLVNERAATEMVDVVPSCPLYSPYLPKIAVKSHLTNHLSERVRDESQLPSSVELRMKVKGAGSDITKYFNLPRTIDGRTASLSHFVKSRGIQSSYESLHATVNSSTAAA